MPFVLRYVLGDKPTDRFAINLESPETTRDVTLALRYRSRKDAAAAAGDGPWRVDRDPDEALADGPQPDAVDAEFVDEA